MKAVYFEEHGDIDKMIYGDFPDPDVPPSHVKLQVLAVSLNWLDIETRRGMPNVRLPLPMITGGDCVGRIVEVGADVTGWRVGERVLVDPFFVEPGQRIGEMLGETVHGALAAFVVVRPRQMIRLPDTVSSEDAACLPVAYGTAYRMVFTRGHIAAGEKVLILGASGGVGNASVLLCKMIGAHVIAVGGSARKCADLERLGADEVIDSSTTDFVKAVRANHGSLMRGGGVDVIINVVGGDTWPACFRCIKHQGRILTCGASAGYYPNTDIRYIFSAEMSIIGCDGWSPNDQTAMLDLVASGRIKPHIDRVMPLSEGIEACRLLETRQVSGKIVLQP